MTDAAAKNDIAGPLGRLERHLGSLLEPAAWQALWQSLGVTEPPWAVYSEILQRYAEPRRAYHGIQHLAECLEVRQRLGTDAQAPAEIDLALWFHDAIHDPFAHDNEVRSAAWLDEVAGGLGLEPAVRARLVDLVLATRHDTAPASQDASILVDTDLAILGAPTPRFLEYQRQVRAEYRQVPEFIYRRKRRKVLQGFSQRPRIYTSPRYFMHLEASARANLAQALATPG